MYQKILVPHAGTPEGDIALKHALEIAKPSSEILIIHVIEEFPHVPVLALHSSQSSAIKRQIAEITKELKTSMEEEMEKKLAVCKKHNVRASVKITVGMPAEEILKIVHNQKIDLIVIAKRRKLKGIKALLTLGSVSRKIVENTSCPVLMIDVEEKRK